MDQTWLQEFSAKTGGSQEESEFHLQGPENYVSMTFQCVNSPAWDGLKLEHLPVAFMWGKITPQLQPVYSIKVRGAAERLREPK